jgi:putative flippase GtrA
MPGRLLVAHRRSVVAVEPSVADRPRLRLPGGPQAQKFLKYCMTSVVGVVMGQSLLFFFASILDWGGVASNVAAVAISTGPTYLLSRAWIWQKRGRNSLYAEVIPFWIMTFLGLVLSSLCVWWFEQMWPDQKLVVNLGNIAGFGVLWLAKFFVLDRVLWKVTHEHPEGPAPFL